jgi:hypothetical protein
LLRSEHETAGGLMEWVIAAALFVFIVGVLAFLKMNERRGR